MINENNALNFAATMISPEKDAIPFPVKIVDIAGPVELTSPEKCIGIRQQTSPEDMVASMAKTGIWGAVQFTREGMDQRLALASRLIQNPKGFLDNISDQVFRLNSKTLNPVTERRWSFRASNQKKNILNTVYEYLKDIPGAKPLADTIYYIADELFTNALYNAPFADSDYTLERSTLVSIDPAFSSEIIISYNAKKLFIGCLDYFGSFNCEEFLKRTAENFTLKADSLKKSGLGGAGIGMLRIIDLSPEIIAVVEKDKRTLIGCSFPLGTTARKVRELPRNFFFQDFENFESESLTLRVERREGRTHVRCEGRCDDKAPLKNLNLIGAKELTIDLRLVQEITGTAFDKFFMSLKNLKHIEKIFFDYVPQTLLPQINVLKDKVPNLIQIRSLYKSTRCPSCQILHNILLENTGISGHSPLPPPVCSCGATFQI